MTCYNHPSMPAAARCAQCGKEICAVCAVRVGDKTSCRDCADFLRSQLPPEVEEIRPEAQAPAETPVAGVSPMPVAEEPPKGAPKEVSQPSPAGESSGVPAPVTSSTVAPAVKSVPPATVTHDPGAGGRKAKEPLLSAGLSLILPGAGQVYNGQMSRGLVLAALYLGSLAIIFGGIVITALSSARNSNTGPMSCCCLPMLIVPLGILIYAIYDAYNTADKINFNKPVEEWP